ncbi:MAG: ArsR family transcriptional regulator [Methanoregulaceae archaeon]|nr:ArsR family transcriptional regulator [Methanoregulaceae archaeon]
MSRKTENSSELALREAQEQFILEWGRMSSSWGINRTMAQILALLFSSSVPLTVDEIMERLRISRGNASMSLRDLMDWGIVRRFRRPGERRDTYVSDSDPWVMFAKVVRERKRREVDPTVSAIRDCLARVPESEETETKALRERLSGLLEVFGLLDAAYQQVFATDQGFRNTMRLFRSDS